MVVSAVTDAAIRVLDVRKSYGDIHAVDGVSFEVLRGEVFGLLGPNGAGKTTTVEMLEGCASRTAASWRSWGSTPSTSPTSSSSGSGSPSRPPSSIRS